MRHHFRCEEKGTCPTRVFNVGPIDTPVDVATP
jgi:hypothetical protein